MSFNFIVRKQISDYLHDYAHTQPQHEALIFDGQRLNYQKLSAQVDRCARALLAVGINKGDRVAVLCTTRLEYWVTFLAVTQVGGIWLGLNPKYRLPEIRYVVEDAKPTLLFAISHFEQQHYADYIAALQQDYPFIQRIVALAEPMNDCQPFADFLALADEVNPQQLADRQHTIDTQDPALLVYTSGSTGKPKGALLSHYGLCFGAAVQHQHFQVKQPRIACSFPINHVACVADTCCVNLVAGGTLLLQERFDAGAQLKAIDKERLSILGGVPTMLMMLLDHPDFASTDFSSLELIIWGGAAMPIPLIERLQTLAPRLMNVYGMTETAANTTYTAIDADIVELSETIGRPSPHMPCRIMNTEGQPCAVGEEGELQFKGEYLLLEYLNRPDATRDVYTDDGWLHTGDLGYWRDNGSITLVGRMSEMFKSGGYNVYPREIEDVLESHPAVDMAAVVGVPDKKYQEVGAAFVVLKTLGSAVTEEELTTHCRDNLANYKVPKTLTLLPSLPTLPVGKVDKVALKKHATEANQMQKTAENS